MYRAGIIKNIDGKEITFELNEEINMEELAALRDGELPTAEITFHDQRRRSPIQNGKAHALMGEIATWSGHFPEYVKEWMKYYFAIEYGIEYFSMSDVDMTTCRHFITYLIDFCFEWDVPFKTKGIELTDDVSSYLYSCIKHRKCALCGTKAEIHHIDAIGQGRDRTKYDHTQSRLIALCRTHHQTAHNQGWLVFSEKNQVAGIKLNARDVKKFKIR